MNAGMQCLRLLVGVRMLHLMRKVMNSLKGFAGSGVCVMMWLAMALIGSDSALAQATPDSPTIRQSPPVWWGYAILFLLLVVVLAVSLMPSKRGHQD